MDLLEKQIEVLLHEYDLHRRELFLQIELYHRQTRYIQIYGLFLSSLIALMFGINSGLIGTLRIPNLPGESSQIHEKLPILLFLILAAAVAFYFASTAMSASYMFAILRERMAVIEAALNDVLRNPTLQSYESTIVPRFLGELSYAPGLFPPHVLSGIWRVTLFLSIISILDWASIILLPCPASTLYAIIITAFAIFQIWQYLAIYQKKGKTAIRTVIQEHRPKL